MAARTDQDHEAIGEALGWLRALIGIGEDGKVPSPEGLQEATEAHDAAQAALARWGIV